MFRKIDLQVKLAGMYLLLGMVITGCTSENTGNGSIVILNPVSEINLTDNPDIKLKIVDRLVRYQITYYNIAGEPVIFNVTRDDIRGIEKVSLEGKVVWKVRVGKGLAWDIYFDKNGDKIIKEEQRFMT